MLRISTFKLIWFLSIVTFLLAGSVLAGAEAYDPLLLLKSTNNQTIDTIVHDTKRNRDIPILVYLPAVKTPVPVVVFSHGLGGSRMGSSYLGKHWSARGYVAVFVQHAGSDSSLWKNKARNQRLKALKGAIRGGNGLKNTIFRVQDIPAVLDQLERWNHDSKHALAGRLDLKQIGMSGHSFGAITTQLVSGQSDPKGETRFTDPRIKAAIVFSPSSPYQGDPAVAFAKVKIPWMLMTGTKDIAAVGKANLQSRLAVFPALPPGGKYELVLYNGQHAAFTESPQRRNAKKRNPNHHRIILALSSAFWDTWLRGDPAAKNWLEGNGPHSTLEAKDTWQIK